MLKMLQIYMLNVNQSSGLSAQSNLGYRTLFFGATKWSSGLRRDAMVVDQGSYFQKCSFFFIGSYYL